MFRSACTSRQLIETLRNSIAVFVRYSFFNRQRQRPFLRVSSSDSATDRAKCPAVQRPAFDCRYPPHRLFDQAHLHRFELTPFGRQIERLIKTRVRGLLSSSLGSRRYVFLRWSGKPRFRRTPRGTEVIRSSSSRIIARSITLRSSRTLPATRSGGKSPPLRA